jgi:hypothetical protein
MMAKMGITRTGIFPTHGSPSTNGDMRKNEQ